MSEYPIKKGIPIPPVKRGHRSCNWPFAHMEVGDCFDAPKDKKRAVAAAITNWKRNHLGWDFTRRVQEDGTIRVWCTGRPDRAATECVAAQKPEPAPVRKPVNIPKLDGKSEISSVTEKLRAAATQGGTGLRTVRMR